MDKLGKFYLDACEAHEEQLAERFSELFESCVTFEKICQKQFGKQYVSLFCSVERLDSAVKSYFFDIYRYKHFHGMLDKNKETNINFPKIFAFTIKWFLKEKPLYLKITNEDELIKVNPKVHKQLVILADRINEELVFNWMNSSHYGHFKKKTSIQGKDRKNFIYNLKFRDISTGFLEMYLTGKVNNGAVKPT